MNITPEFLQWLRDIASEAEATAGYGGRFDDGGSSHLRELICAFEAGRDDKIPSFWVEELGRFNQKNKDEYELYLRLKTRFEPNAMTKK